MVPKILIHESSEIPSHYGSIDSGVDESGFQQIELNPCGVISEEVDEEEPSTSKIKVRNKYEIRMLPSFLYCRETDGSRSNRGNCRNKSQIAKRFMSIIQTKKY